ncbi:hypothetical protein OG520_28055 [Streptomyces sp. NBC_00984]|uniref:hypothetical protein n=1 Tax=Streptomyces sp. NBC_00984 TaxID=2903700 RepID=UPI00386D16AF|nr:hypothetical protein OG520_28055 [Streptomyces sp. NBC_00984]
MADHVTTDLTRPAPAAMVRDHVTAALRAGITPTSPQPAPVIKAITAEYAHTTGHHLLALLETAKDPRRRRYLQLLAVINSWPPPDNPGPAFTWLIEALASNNTADAPEAGRT